MMEETNGEFTFETDHLALRGNKDYCELLKYIVRLEAIKMKALKDIEDLTEAQNKALVEPLLFVEELKKDKIKFPPRQTVPDLPRIDWNKYGIDVLDCDETTSANDENDSITRVRGRKFTDNKPETFNQLWSCEEQKRLEELLEIYPEEPIESKRFKKIAEALGTRTPIQVMSRIQKYFAKLAKVGLPIPGRIPKRVAKDKTHTLLYKRSTFFPQLQVPVKMEEPFENAEIYGETSTVDTTNIGDKSMIELLKSAREQRILDETDPIFQTNTMCVGCQKTGFLGARWTDNAGTDYCTDCLIKLLPTEKLIPVRIVM